MRIESPGADDLVRLRAQREREDLLGKDLPASVQPAARRSAGESEEVAQVSITSWFGDELDRCRRRRAVQGLIDDGSTGS